MAEPVPLDMINEGFWRAVMSPMLRPAEFMSQAMFGGLVLAAERAGLPPGAYLGAGPVIVHPDSWRWFAGRLALARMREHFGMLDG